jgi:hypothetical protein
MLRAAAIALPLIFGQPDNNRLAPHAGWMRGDRWWRHA